MATCTQNIKRDDGMWCGVVVKELLVMLESANYQCLHIKYLIRSHILTHLTGFVFTSVLKNLAGCSLSHSESNCDAPYEEKGFM